MDIGVIGIIIALIFGIASVVSSYFNGYVPTKRNEDIKKLNDKVKTLLQDVDSLLKIEDELIKEYKDAQNKSEITIKKEIRGRVRDATNYTLSNYTKPSSLTKELSRFE